MKQVMNVCIWTCIACIIAGAILGLLLVWNVVGGEHLYPFGMTFAIVFLAAALTLAFGKSYLSKDPSA